MQKVLISGANGFVGSHVLSALMDDKEVEVVAACRNADKIPFKFNGEIREGDLRDKNYTKKILADIDVICHAASWTSLWGHKKQSKKLFLEPSLNLIDTAKEAGVKKFINVSSTSAASPNRSREALSHGIYRSFWPHLNNVILIEDNLRQQASADFKVVNLRLGLFAGKNYALGLIPILLPRLKTHLVPWVSQGKTSMPIIDGEDIAQAFCLSVKADELPNFEAFNIVGPKVPSVREVVGYIHKQFSYPLPHFNVPFFIAYKFAWLMEMLHHVLPGDPLVTRSIVHLMEEVSVNNDKATKKLGYRPEIPWQQALDKQIKELEQNQDFSMRMHKAWKKSELV